MTNEQIEAELKSLRQGLEGLLVQRNADITQIHAYIDETITALETISRHIERQTQIFEEQTLLMKDDLQRDEGDEWWKDGEE